MPDQNKQKIRRQETGAAAVEFAFALMALFGFFAVFMQIVIFFIAGERLSFAGFAAARTCAVEGSGPAIQVAVSIDPEAMIEIDGNRVALTRNIPVPAGIAPVVTGGAHKLTITHVSPLFIEPTYKDDNPDPF